MAFFRYGAPVLALLPFLGFTRALGLGDIDHVVLFMQENRAFDHYLGTMAGVRGFADPNVHYNGKHPVWDQVTNPTLTKDSDFVHPWYLNYLGGNWTEATQCMNAGSNGWTENQLAFNGGANDHWAVNNTPWSIGFYKREDLPVHFALAEEWIVGDMYQEGVIASTNPNRVTWVSGSINVPGGPQKPDEGGNPYIDNNETPGCESGGINCYPLKWKTTAEMYEQAGVSWQVYQDADNFDDNPLAWFEQFQNAPVGSPLHSKGMQGLSLDTFYAQAANGTLPEISIIVGPAELSEHPPHSPNDGAWLQRKVAEAVITSPKYSKTALFISYDETGGWADHVIPFHSPVDTPGEWLTDPTTGIGHTFQGPGFRLPFWIISPFTRHGGVYTEHCDHNSQIMFIEQWQAAKGRNVTTDEMVPWRRQNMASLVNAFDFDNPDFTIPNLPAAKQPHVNAGGNYDGAAFCESQFRNPRPPVPYTGPGAIKDVASLAETGFKTVRGMLTEGRFLVLETDGLALTNPSTCGSGSGSESDDLALTRASPQHDRLLQRWVIHAVVIGGDEFTFTSAVDGRYICDGGKLCGDSGKATVFVVDFKPGKGHGFEVKGSGGGFLVASGKKLSFSGEEAFWQVFSVTGRGR